ncbi:hypothetical protein V2J09_020783, partial [Rumex salicifolius]
ELSLIDYEFVLSDVVFAALPPCEESRRKAWGDGGRPVSTEGDDEQCRVHCSSGPVYKWAVGWNLPILTLVQSCVSTTCGRFCHARCIGKAFHIESNTQTRNVKAQVAAGDMFTCSIHKCFVYGHGEERDVHALQYAICRRIYLDADHERNILTYDGLGTLARDHIVLFENSMKTKGQNITKFGPLERTPCKKLSKYMRCEIVFGLKAKKVVKGLSSGGIPMKNMTRLGSSKFSTTHGMFQKKETCHLPISNGMRLPKNFKILLKNTSTTKLVVLQMEGLICYIGIRKMIVDFSCGSNDFSCSMSKKLDNAGKNCFFKNFDIIHPKNDFNFERRDWFIVHGKKLPIGSRLIIGLNSPFGFKAKLANQFFDKTPHFKPKLVILIIPRETQRFDEKRTSYGMIWENARLLVGKVHKAILLPPWLHKCKQEAIRTMEYGITSTVSMEPVRLDIEAWRNSHDV